MQAARLGAFLALALAMSACAGPRPQGGTAGAPAAETPRPAPGRSPALPSDDWRIFLANQAMLDRA